MGLVAVLAGLGVWLIVGGNDSKSSTTKQGFDPSSMYAGYPSTSDTQDFVVQRVEATYGPSATTKYLKCAYFMPVAGQPPLWDCSVRVTSQGVDIWYDNLQITGRPDQTWDCYDGSQTDNPIC